MKPQPSGQRDKLPCATHKGLSNFTYYSIMVVFAAMMFFSCENPIAIVKELTQEDTLAAITAREVVYIRSDSGEIQMRLTAPRMNRFDGDNPAIEFPEGFMAYFFDTLNIISSTIKADYGINYEKTKLMLAQNNVEVENFDKQEKLNTETLFWDQQNKTIFTRAAVTITSPDRVIYGDSLTAAEGFEQRVIHNIRAVIEFEEEEDGS
jgi:LPS export ABC transporter protein LptC